MKFKRNFDSQAKSRLVIFMLSFDKKKKKERVFMGF